MDAISNFRFAKRNIHKIISTAYTLSLSESLSNTLIHSSDIKNLFENLFSDTLSSTEILILKKLRKVFDDVLTIIEAELNDENFHCNDTFSAISIGINEFFKWIEIDEIIAIANLNRELIRGGIGIFYINDSDLTQFLFLLSEYKETGFRSKLKYYILNNCIHKYKPYFK